MAVVVVVALMVDLGMARLAVRAAVVLAVAIRIAAHQQTELLIRAEAVVERAVDLQGQPLVLAVQASSSSVTQTPTPQQPPQQAPRQLQ
jgi:hypothetical protein